MQCQSCDQPAVFNDPTYCNDHFVDYVETTVQQTIDDYDLLDDDDSIAVGASGGKDSTTLLYILKETHGDVTAVAIDEGIAGYRDGSLDHLKEFCTEHDIDLELYSFEDAFGKPLDDMDWENVGGKPCTTCGTLRRFLLNKHSNDYDKIAVGHNLDDEAQSVLMNLMRSNVKMMGRTGPKTSDRDEFTQRIKPLYFLTEKEIATYAYLQGFIDEFVECPNAHMAYRIWLRDLLNDYEQDHPGAKRNLVKMHLKLKDDVDPGGGLQECERCGEPASNDVCNACRIKSQV
jgi:uncharacterized protein (TIGR00269 family)